MTNEELDRLRLEVVNQAMVLHGCYLTYGPIINNDHFSRVFLRFMEKVQALKVFEKKNNLT